MANHTNIAQDYLSKALTLLSLQLESSGENKADELDLAQIEKNRNLKDKFQSHLADSEEKQDTDSLTVIPPAVIAEAMLVLNEKVEKEHQKLKQLSQEMESAENEAKTDFLTREVLELKWGKAIVEKLRLIAQGPYPKYFDEVIAQATHAVEKFADNDLPAFSGLKVELEVALALIYKAMGARTYQVKDENKKGAYKAMDCGELVHRYAKRTYRHAEEGQANDWLRKDVLVFRDFALDSYRDYITQLKARRDFCANYVEGQAKVLELSNKIKLLMLADRVITEMTKEEKDLFDECEAIQGGERIALPLERIPPDAFAGYEKVKMSALSPESSYFVFRSWCELVNLKAKQALSSMSVSLVELEADLAEVNLALIELNKFINTREQQALLSPEEYLECQRYLHHFNDCQEFLNTRLEYRRANSLQSLDQALNDSVATLSLQGTSDRRRSIWQPVPDPSTATTTNTLQPSRRASESIPSLPALGRSTNE